MKSNTKIERQTKKEYNPELVNTIREARKHKAWKQIAEILAGPRRLRPDVNLSQIEKETREGDIVVIPGKVLSQGEVSKKIRVVAFSFSEKAKEKLLKVKAEVSSILHEIKKDPTAKGVKILK